MKEAILGYWTSALPPPFLGLDRMTTVAQRPLTKRLIVTNSSVTKRNFAMSTIIGNCAHGTESSTIGKINHGKPRHPDELIGGRHGTQ
jgi:hypothetical protein